MKYLILLSILFFSCEKGITTIDPIDIERQSYIYSITNNSVEDLNRSQISRDIVEGDKRFLISTSTISDGNDEINRVTLNLKYLTNNDNLYVDFGYNVVLNNFSLTRTRYSSELPIRVEYNNSFEDDTLLHYSGTNNFSVSDSKQILEKELNIATFPNDFRPTNLSLNSIIDQTKDIDVTFEEILDPEKIFFGFYIKKSNSTTETFLNIQFTKNESLFTIDQLVVAKFLSDHFSNGNELFFFTSYVDPAHTSLPIDLKSNFGDNINVPVAFKSFSSFKINIQ